MIWVEKVSLLLPLWFLLPLTVRSVNEDSHLSNLLYAVKNALYSGASSGDVYRRPQDIHYSSSNGISLGVYEALLSITRNDDLECVPRLLCEAAAGGRPGYSGKDLKFDKTSLTKFISYLNLGPSKGSPLLTFARAALLGVTNRGDPYSCIINYSKCPKDQARLLHYLNNHRGGFFQYFDRQDQNHHQTNRPTYQHSGIYDGYRPLKYKTNRIKFENTSFYKGLKKKATSGKGFYANRYPYLTFKFPVDLIEDDGRTDHRKRMIFPEESGRRGRRENAGDPRILNQTSKGKFSFDANDSSSKRRPKEFSTNSYFFPEGNGQNVEDTDSYGGVLATDRLPPRFHFPLSDNIEDEDLGSKGSTFFPN